MPLPQTVPEQDAPGLWKLQVDLLRMAQDLCGQRDESKIVYQPSFHEAGPHLRHTVSLDGSFVELSPNSKVYWPTVVYEMAHETIHLLDPVVGFTTWLEEGIAVAFSLHAQAQYGVTVQCPRSGPYFDALQLVRALPDGAFDAARRVRERYGPLGSVTVDQLRELFPNHDNSALNKLAERCVPK